jgi:hypothetical protein
MRIRRERLIAHANACRARPIRTRGGTWTRPALPVPRGLSRRLMGSQDRSHEAANRAVHHHPTRDRYAVSRARVQTGRRPVVPGGQPERLRR